MTLDFAGREKCEGQYRGSTSIAAKQISLECTNGKTGIAIIDATQVTNTASVRYNIEGFRKGSIAISLGGQVAEPNQPSSTQQTPATSKKPESRMVENYSGLGDPGPIAAEAGEFPTQYRSAVAAYLKRYLKDPYSFIDGRIARPFYVGRLHPTWIVCVQGRSKNSYGAYTGLKFFELHMRKGKVLDYATEEGEDAWWCNRNENRLALSKFTL